MVMANYHLLLFSTSNSHIDSIFISIFILNFLIYLCKMFLLTIEFKDILFMNDELGNLIEVIVLHI